MAVKRFNANSVMCIAIIGWSAVTLGMAWCTNYQQILAMRFLLGLFEAALFSSLTFVVSTIYSREHQGKRVAALYASSAISGAFGGLISYGIQIRGEQRGIAAWRWLFIAEGIISVSIGMISWWSLPRNAESAWFLTEEESQLMMARKKKYAIYKGEDTFNWKWIRMGFTDPIIYLAGVGLFAASVPMFGFSTFLPTILLGMGYDSLQANYLTIPVYSWAVVCLFTWLYFSDKMGVRTVIGMLTPIPVIIGYGLVVGTSNSAVGYFAMFLCGSGEKKLSDRLRRCKANR